MEKTRATHLMIDSLNERVTDTRKMVTVGIALVLAFSAATFGLTLGAAEFAKETHVTGNNSVMTDVSGNVVQTKNLHNTISFDDVCAFDTETMSQYLTMAEDITVQDNAVTKKYNIHSYEHNLDTNQVELYTNQGSLSLSEICGGEVHSDRRNLLDFDRNFGYLEESVYDSGRSGSGLSQKKHAAIASCDRYNKDIVQQCKNCADSFFGSAVSCGNINPIDTGSGHMDTCEIQPGSQSCEVHEFRSGTNYKVYPQEDVTTKVEVHVCFFSSCDIFLAGSGNKPSQAAHPGHGQCTVTQATQNSSLPDNLKESCQVAGKHVGWFNCEPRMEKFLENCNKPEQFIWSHSWGTINPGRCNLPVHYVAGMCPKDAKSCWRNSLDPVPFSMRKCCILGLMGQLLADTSIIDVGPISANLLALDGYNTADELCPFGQDYDGDYTNAADITPLGSLCIGSPVIALGIALSQHDMTKCYEDALFQNMGRKKGHPYGHTAEGTRVIHSSGVSPGSRLGAILGGSYSSGSSSAPAPSSDEMMGSGNGSM